MNTSFERSANTTDEWYTPKEIVDALGKFELDPCSPARRALGYCNTAYHPRGGWIKAKLGGGYEYGLILLILALLLSVL